MIALSLQASKYFTQISCPGLVTDTFPSLTDPPITTSVRSVSSTDIGWIAVRIKQGETKRTHAEDENVQSHYELYPIAATKTFASRFLFC